jgi:hypothetical protein
MKDLIQLYLKGELLEDLKEFAEVKEICLEEATMYVLDIYHSRLKNSLNRHIGLVKCSKILIPMKFLN